jgi:hypothetical protein
MKKIVIPIVALCLASCSIFGGPDYEPAIAANKGQSAYYEELRQAFIMVIMKSKNATETQKAAALGDIESNRVDFYNFNSGLEQFLVVNGSVDPGRVIEIGRQIYEQVRGAWEKGGEPEQPGQPVPGAGGDGQ